MTHWLVVGGGAAGCVVAGRLSTDPDVHVTLLEAGADHAPDIGAADRGPSLDDPERLGVHDVVRRAGGPTFPYLVGRGLGGSSLVNGSVAVAAGPGGSGRGHDLPLVDATRIGPIGRALLAADRRARPLRLIHRDGRRVTAADVYLRPHVGRTNLTVRTEVPVAEVVLAGRRVTGVRTVSGEVVDADRVVVCAGAIATPALLVRSGIDTPGLGEGLHDHPAFAVALTLDPDRLDDDAHAITVAITAPHHQILALERTEPGSHHGALLVGLTDVSSRGRVTLGDGGRIVVELNQLDTEADRHRMVSAVFDALDVLERRPLADVVRTASIDDRGTPVAALAPNRRAVEDWVLDHLTGFHHVAGSCRRGVVTDDDGWVRGVDGLAVGDASLFAEAPQTNIYLATILQAERLAARWSIRVADDPGSVGVDPGGA